MKKMEEVKTNLGCRTNFDFSEHELIINKSDGLLVHTLKHKEYSRMYRFDFIKIKIASTQEPFEFDQEETEKLIRDGIDGELEAYGFSGDELETMIEYYEDTLLYNVDECEERYMVNAHDNMPSFCDSESIPHITKIKHWLLCVFDAFEEICIRLKEKE